MRQKHFRVVHGGEPEEVVLAHLAQLFPIHVLEHGRVDLQQAVLLDGPLQPLAHMVLGPQRWVCRSKEEEEEEGRRKFVNEKHHIWLLKTAEQQICVSAKVPVQNLSYIFAGLFQSRRVCDPVLKFQLRAKI